MLRLIPFLSFLHFLVLKYASMSTTKKSLNFFNVITLNYIEDVALLGSHENGIHVVQDQNQ